MNIRSVSKGQPDAAALVSAAAEFLPMFGDNAVITDRTGCIPKQVLKAVKKAGFLFYRLNTLQFMRRALLMA